jgi:alanine racemase
MMPESSSTESYRALVSIDLKALEENYRAITTLLGPGVGTLCIVKADAYGHGAVQVARRLEAAGAPYLGVATLDEGIELREQGISGPILVLGGVMPWESLELMIERGLTLGITNGEMLERAAAYRGAKRCKVHVKIDTGMGRLGFGPWETDNLARRLRGMTHLEVEGIMSHFASSEKRDEQGVRQIDAFKSVLALMKENGIEPRFVHMSNSGAICNYPEAHFSMVRPGIMLYGAFPEIALCEKLGLQPVMTLSARISFIRTVPAHYSLSYGRTYVTQRETKVAILPLGYSHGYPRVLSNRGLALVRGKRCPIVGRVCMDWLLVDVTDVPNAGTGEEAVFLGRAEGGATITANEVAEQAGTIPYEILCSVSRRIPRRYV